MLINVNNSYEQFYKGTEQLKNYGSNGKGKTKLARYEFNTTDEKGNKIMDKMSREETLQAMKDVRSKYGDDVIVEFSGDGMAKLIESRKGQLDTYMTQEEQDAMEARNAAFQSEIKHYDKSVNNNNENMDYGVKRGNYLGHGSNMVYTTDAVDMMRTMDSSAYTEYQKISKEDGGMNSLKYLTNWFVKN